MAFTLGRPSVGRVPSVSEYRQLVTLWFNQMNTNCQPPSGVSRSFCHCLPRTAWLTPYSLPRAGFRASEGRGAPAPERSGLRWRLRNPRAGSLCAKGCQWYFGGAEHAPFRDEFLTLIVATIVFRAKRCALTLDEPLQMMSPQDSFYKDFAAVKVACRPSNLTHFRSPSRD